MIVVRLREFERRLAQGSHERCRNKIFPFFRALERQMITRKRLGTKRNAKIDKSREDKEAENEKIWKSDARTNSLSRSLSGVVFFFFFASSKEREFFSLSLSCSFISCSSECLVERSMTGTYQLRSIFFFPLELSKTNERKKKKIREPLAVV